LGIVDELENAIDVVELVQKYTSIKKAGTNFKWLCPFPGHSEKTPSFMVSPAKQMAYCFGCHKWGGALKFVMDIENCEFKEAIEILGNLTWIAVNTNFDKEKYAVKKNMYSLYKDAANYYAQSLEKYPEIKKYLIDRWINNESIKNFHIWYAGSWVELYNYLKEKWYEENQIKNSNIFVDIKSRKDKFIWRVIFPIQNARWDFVAFTWRITSSWEPKYLNSPASDIYDKSSILYWLYTARSSVTKIWYIIITEWNADTIALQQYGFFNSVAVSWTALTEKHITIIKRLTHKIYLCFDWDKAGEKATKLSIEMLKNNDIEVKIILLKWWKDPDEILQKWWKESFDKLVKEAVTPIGYYIKKSDFNLNSIDDKKNLLILLLDIVKSYSNNIEKDFYLKEIATLLDINQKIIYDSFNKIRKKREQKTKVLDKVHFTSECLAIWHIIFNENSLKVLKENIIFPDEIWQDLKSFLESPEQTLQSFELEKKERYKWLALRIEEEDRLRTDENKGDVIIKLAKKINIDIFKKISGELKEKMNSWDENAFLEYSKLIKKAKENNIK